VSGRIPVTILMDGQPLDLRDAVVTCLWCGKRITPIDAERGKLLPHAHEPQAGACSGIKIATRDAVEAGAVIVDGLSADEMAAERPVGIRRIISLAGQRQDWFSEQWIARLVPIADAAVRWERAGILHELRRQATAAEKLALSVHAADEEGAAAAWSQHATLVDVIEEIEGRDAESSAPDVVAVADVDHGQSEITADGDAPIGELLEDTMAAVAQITELQREVRRLTDVLTQVQAQAKAHHGDEPPNRWLHALCVEIPEFIDGNLRAPELRTPESDAATIVALYVPAEHEQAARREIAAAIRHHVEAVLASDGPTIGTPEQRVVDAPQESIHG
jgi:hypothetical protein